MDNAVVFVFNSQLINQMKKNLLAVAFLLLASTLSSQVIYVNSTDNKLYKLDLEACSYDYLTNINAQAFDITFHPNGNLYGLSGSGRIYQIDTLTGATVDLHKMHGQNFNSLTADKEGIMYATGNLGEIWSYNLETDVSINHGGMGFNATGDLTFYQGNLYAAVSGNRIALVDVENPDSSSIVLQQYIQGEIFGIVSYIDDCEVKSYAITNENSDIYEIDFEGESMNFVCELNIEIGGGASTFEFLASDPLLIDTVSFINPNCNSSDGQISIFASGGAGNFTYSVDGNNFVNQNTFNNLPPGLYTAYVQDQNDCIYTYEVELEETNTPEITQLSVEDPTCENSNGTLFIIVEGGSGIIEYSIDGENYQESNIFNELSPGEYSVSVRDGAGCTDSSIATLSTAGNPLLTIEEIIQTSCNSPNGRVEISADGGTPPFLFSIDDIDFQESGGFDELSAGIYTAMVIDAKECQNTLIFEIEASEPPLELPVSYMHTTCGEANGSIHVEIGNEPINALFSIDGQTFQEEVQFENLNSGPYTVFIKNVDDCISSQMIDIEESTALSFSNVVVQPTECGKDIGSISFEMTGGEGDPTVLFNDQTYFLDFNFGQLSGGLYTISAMDTSCETDTLIDVPSTECPIYISNIFSPNDDGVNDYFTIVVHPDFGGSFTSFKVYDRWGAEVCSEDSIDKNGLQWDGTMAGTKLSSGVYVYQLRYENLHGEDKLVMGDVTIVR